MSDTVTHYVESHIKWLERCISEHTDRIDELTAHRDKMRKELAEYKEQLKTSKQNASG